MSTWMAMSLPQASLIFWMTSQVKRVRFSRVSAPYWSVRVLMRAVSMFFISWVADECSSIMSKPAAFSCTAICTIVSCSHAMSSRVMVGMSAVPAASWKPM